MLTLADSPVKAVQDASGAILEGYLVAAYYFIGLHVSLGQRVHEVYEILAEKGLGERFLRPGQIVLNGHHGAWASVLNLYDMGYERRDVLAT